MGLGHAILCAERVVGNDPIAVLLADDFLTHIGNGVTSNLVNAFEVLGRSQLSVTEVAGPNISKNGVNILGSEPGLMSGLFEKPDADKAPANLASIGRYFLTPDIFDVLRNQPAGAGGEIQLVDAINTQAENDAVEAVRLNGRRFDCGSVDGYLDAIMQVVNLISLYSLLTRSEHRHHSVPNIML